MNLAQTRLLFQTRRQFFRQCQLGLGGIALSQLMAGASKAATAGSGSDNANAPRASMIPAKAKRIIYLHMSGAPPQMDMFDYKPKLNELHMTPCPDEFFKGKRLAFIKGHPKLLGCQQDFVRAGRNGTMISELLPNFASVIDDVSIIRSMYTDQFNHAPAELLLFTGSAQFGHASMGSWVTYGLGSENQDLPGFVVLGSGGTDPSGGKSLWSSGFLPSVYQGVQCRTSGEPILYVTNPEGMDRSVRRRSLDALNRLNALEYEAVGDPETLTRISQYELAYRMQISVPEVMDISKEPQKVIEAYGAEPGKSSFANNCLLARKLAEQGVRFIQLFDWGWDIHGNSKDNALNTALPSKCRDIDQPMTALLKDLKQRGLLEDTLVVWGGEFGRTPMNEARGGVKWLGRDHHPDCFTIWMAGAGVKQGFVYGETDELGYSITRNRMHVHDLQATILHLMGMDAHHFAFPFQGLNNRLIGPSDAPAIHRDILA